MKSSMGRLRPLWNQAVTIERVVIVASIGAIFFFAGVRYRSQTSQTSGQPFFTNVADQSSPGQEKSSSSITVTVAGAVQKPGRYTFGPNARIQAAIQAAGGFSANADKNGVNLAAYLENGARIVVPQR